MVMCGSRMVRVDNHDMVLTKNNININIICGKRKKEEENPY